MPATKQLQDREEKRQEIVAAARRRFVEDGYEQTSMSALATAAGVAPNTVYWYFADKDAVLIAVLDAVLADAWAEYQALADAPAERQLLWVVQELQQLRRLVGTVHARIDQSPAVDAWHDAFHTMTEAVLRTTVELADAPASAAGVASATGVGLAASVASVDAEVKLAVFAIEGMLAHHLTAEQQQDICRALAGRWARP